MPSNQRETFQLRELSDDELEVLRVQVESFDSIDEIDPEIREIIARRWPDLLSTLPANNPDPEHRHSERMADERPKGTHNPRPGSIQRWENEGGATKGAKRRRVSSRLEKQGKAANFAGRAIDDLADRSATSEERETRKRRLVKGPKEFRKVRRDQGK